MKRLHESKLCEQQNIPHLKCIYFFVPTRKFYLLYFFLPLSSSWESWKTYFILYEKQTHKNTRTVSIISTLSSRIKDKQKDCATKKNPKASFPLLLSPNDSHSFSQRIVKTLLIWSKPVFVVAFLTLSPDCCQKQCKHLKTTFQGYVKLCWWWVLSG